MDVPEIWRGGSKRSPDFTDERAVADIRRRVNQRITNGSAARTMKPTVFKAVSSVLGTQISRMNVQALARPD